MDFILIQEQNLKIMAFCGSNPDRKQAGISGELCRGFNISKLLLCSLNIRLKPAQIRATRKVLIRVPG